MWKPNAIVTITVCIINSIPAVIVINCVTVYICRLSTARIAPYICISSARKCSVCAFLIGIDLRKDTETLHAAYNDSRGITAAFNLNLLSRINHELDATFDLTAFRHDAPWVEEHGRIEMRLHSTVAQTVTVAGTTVQFAEGEYIHTENSHKYSVEEFQVLARSAGYEPAQVWVDDAERFSLHYLKG